MNYQTTLDKLNSFIDAKSPKLATFLARQSKAQQNAITYKELREAIFQGQFSLSYLAQWQQDYSGFVLDHYTPLVNQAVMQAATDLGARYGGLLFDPQIGLMDDFIKDHGGQLIREVTQTQYKAINSLVRQAAMTETMTVDQLARAIRPCVGLTQRQAQAVKNYYDSLVAQGYGAKNAQKKQAVYAERMHRLRASMIAQTETAYAYNASADALVRQNIQNGYFENQVKKRWITAADERVCPTCGAIDGETVDLDAPFSIGVQRPPAHPRCRCAIAYENIKPIIPATTAAASAASATSAASQGAFQQPGTAPIIPDSPAPNALNYKSSVAMGTGGMHQYVDDKGNEWIFKPAQSKYGNHSEPFRAYVQEAGYKVQAIVDPGTAVPVASVTLDTPNGTKFGAIQLRITDVDSTFDLKGWQGGYSAGPDASIISQLQRENVTDWLMCNYDSHGGNFIRVNGTGKLIGVDKEQAFRYLSNGGAQKMSYTFHPNAAYGETEPIYNTIYRKFAKGQIDLDLNDVLPYIQRVEAVPDAAYREIFRDYAEALCGKGASAESLLDDILARKQNLRTSIREFYSEIMTQRSGTATLFKFADELPGAAAAAPIQSVSMSSTALQGMKVSDLKKLAQQKGIKYAWSMTKEQLVDAISDPSKTAQIVSDAKARASGVGRTPKAVPAPAIESRPKIEGIAQLGDAMDDFDAALQNSNLRGVSLISDKAALEGMQTNLRKITIDGRECYELNGKLTHSRWLSAQQNLQRIGKNGDWTFNGASGIVDYKKPILDLTSAHTKKFTRYPIETAFLRDGDDVIVITSKGCETQARAMMGEFNVRIFASDGKTAAQKARAMLQRAGIDDMIDDVDQKALDRYKKMRLIWQNDPQLASTLDPLKSTDADIQTALSRIGITQQRVDKLKLVKVTDGYFTFFDEENVKLAEKKDVAYVWAGISGKESAARILSSGEMISSTQRLKRGILAPRSRRT